MTNRPISNGFDQSNPMYGVKVTTSAAGDVQHVIIDSGGGTANAPAAASVGVATAQALAANSDRTKVILTNTSDNDISLGIGSAAVLYSGITLYTGGVHIEYSTQAINAIASGAASNLGIQEYE